MSLPTSTPSSSHPFAGSHKSSPGQLPLFSAEHYQSSSHLEKLSRHQVHTPGRAKRGISPGGSSDPSGRSRAVFSPGLAGQSRSRKRNEAQESERSRSLDEHQLLAETAGTNDALASRLTDQEEIEFDFVPRRLFASSTIHPQHSIFFSPPSGLAPPLTERARRKDASELTQESNDHQFRSAISRATAGVHSIIDLNHRGICTIPSLIEELCEPETDAIAHNKSKLAACSTEPKRTPSPGPNRHQLSRVRSAPSGSLMIPHRPKTLILSNNYLTVDSGLDKLCNLTFLNVLSLRSNRLTEIPDEIGQMTNLSELHLTNNQLKYLPSTILQLEQCRIFTAGNPWLPKPSKPNEDGRYISIRKIGKEPQPGLVEDCLRKLCVEEGNKIEIEKVEHLPESIIKVLNNPKESFKRCKCGRLKLELKIESFEWRKLDRTKSKCGCEDHFKGLLFENELIPILWKTCELNCIGLNQKTRLET